MKVFISLIISSFVGAVFILPLLAVTTIIVVEEIAQPFFKLKES